MDSVRRAVLKLSAAQALLLTNGVTLIAINGLAGLALAPDRHFATVPVTAYVIGAASSTLPASFFMRRHGRRAGFMLGAGMGIMGGVTCALAIWLASFALLCAGTLMCGIYAAFGQYYRFAAADAVPAEFKARAISWVLAGGIVGGIVGPETAKFTRALMAPTFFASYLVLALFALASLAIVSSLRLPAMIEHTDAAPARPWREIARQPAWLVAVLAAVCGYAVMNLLMSATPLAMDICHHPFTEAAFVLQWHVIAMFAPSFVTGAIIRRIGVLTVLLLGALLLLGCVAIAVSGITLMHFWWALVLLGVGWNFLFIAGTTLLTGTYLPSERAKVQGANDFSIYTVQMIGSTASGIVVTGPGWATLNLIALPLIATTLIATLRLWWRQRVRPA